MYYFLLQSMGSCEFVYGYFFHSANSRRFIDICALMYRSFGVYSWRLRSELGSQRVQSKLSPCFSRRSDSTATNFLIICNVKTSPTIKLVASLRGSVYQKHRNQDSRSSVYAFSLSQSRGSGSGSGSSTQFIRSPLKARQWKIKIAIPHREPE